jgi:uncharacterized membrane protein (UPF0127 family)
MHGMKFALDVLFLDGAGLVVQSYPALPPGARTPYLRAAESVLELPVGPLEATGTVIGDRVVWQPVPPGTEMPGSAPMSNDEAHWARTERRRVL